MKKYFKILFIVSDDFFPSFGEQANSAAKECFIFEGYLVRDPLFFDVFIRIEAFLNKCHVPPKQVVVERGTV